MTCIVALKHTDGEIYMGCDSAGVGGYSRSNRLDPKIYRVGEMLIGFTTSFRMGQLLGYSLTLPRHHADVPSETYMATEFINAVRACLKNGGWAEKEKEVERGGTFLVAYKGRIFGVQSDYQVAENAEPYKRGRLRRGPRARLALYLGAHDGQRAARASGDGARGSGGVLGRRASAVPHRSAGPSVREGLTGAMASVRLNVVKH